MKSLYIAPAECQIHGIYNSSFPNWDEENDDPRETIMVGEDLSEAWKAVTEYMDYIESLRIPYCPTGFNSNSVIGATIAMLAANPDFEAKPSLELTDTYPAPGVELIDFNFNPGIVNPAPDEDIMHFIFFIDIETVVIQLIERQPEQFREEIEEYIKYINDISEWTKEKWESFKETMKEWGDKISKWAEEILEVLKETVEEWTDKISDWAEETLEALKETVEEWIDKISDWAEKTRDSISETVKEWGDKISEVAEKTWDSISETVKEWGENISELTDIINKLKEQLKKATQATSPLILDLDGDGVSTVAVSEGVYFDHDGNGFAQQSGWVGSGDGLLVLDLNENGRIDDGTELFGSNTLLANGKAAANGFAALKAFDTNADGIIDANDAVFSQLRVWKDINTDGYTSEGELFTLESLGIQSLNLAYTTQNVTDAQGNQHRQVGAYTLADGTVREMTDVWFAQDTAFTIETDLVEVSEAISALPNVLGFGNVRSLHQAIARDEGGRLQALVQAFAQETNPETRGELLTEIIYVWAGVENIDPSSRGGNIGDARKIAALEAFLGERYTGGTGQNASKILLQAFDELSLYVSSELMQKTHLAPFFESIKVSLNLGDTGTLDLVVNIDDTVSLLNAAYSNDTENALSLLSNFIYILKNHGEIGERVWNALADTNSLSGGAGNDTILGGAGDDLTFGSNFSGVGIFCHYLPSLFIYGYELHI